MRLVLDANVLLSGFVKRVTAPSTIIDIWERESSFELATSEHILRSVRRALEKPYWLKVNGSSELAVRLDQFVDTMDMVEPVGDVHRVAEDEEDDLVRATDVAAHADYLITGDRYLLEIGAFRGVPIVTPRESLDCLDAEFE